MVPRMAKGDKRSGDALEHQKKADNQPAPEMNLKEYFSHHAPAPTIKSSSPQIIALIAAHNMALLLPLRQPAAALDALIHPREWREVQRPAVVAATRRMADARLGLLHRR